MLRTIILMRERRVADLVREDIPSGAGAELRVHEDRVVLGKP